MCTKKSSKSCTKKGEITGPGWVLYTIEMRQQLGQGIALKPKTQIDKKIFFESQAANNQITGSLDHKDTGVVRQLNKTAIFIAVPMKKKHIQQFILPKCVFLSNC